MKVSLYTNNYNTEYTKYNYSKNNQNKYSTNIQAQKNPSFTGWFGLPSSSKFLDPVKNSFNWTTDKIAKYYTKPLYESKAGKWLAWQKDSDQIVNHMQSIGSIIVSGMYMSQTLRNQNMDDETKKKLSINQGLTWLAATLGAYGVDSVLDEIWDKHISLKHAAKFLYDPENKEYNNIQNIHKKLIKDLEKYNEELKNAYDLKPAEEKRGFLGLKKKFKPISATKYIEKKFRNNALTNNLKGLDVIKSLVIFGTMYRFISPVAVTPIANLVGDKFFGKKEPEKTAIQESIIINRPIMANFAGGTKV